MASPELPFCTCRFCNIPPDFDDAALRAIVPLEESERVVATSLSPDFDASRPSQIGTITWSTTPRRLRHMDLEGSATLDVTAELDPLTDHTGMLTTRRNQVTIDSHFTGLTPLNPSPTRNEIAVDVVAVTGVGGKPFMSWQHISGAMWLRDCLPRDVPTAQVFTYGYPSKLRSSGSHALLLDYTTSFLHELRRLSLRNSLAHRPLVLIGHSYGGLMIKQAIIEAGANPNDYGRLFNSIDCIIFFGVPHRGLNTAALKAMVANEPTKGLIGELGEGSTLVRSLSSRFPEHTKSIKILTCHELLETPTMRCSDGVWKRDGPLEMMVSESSACMFLPNEERQPIYANHSMIAKLSDSQGSEYHAIKDYLISHSASAPASIRRRLLKQECAVALSEVYTLAEFIYMIVSNLKKNPFESKNFKKHMAHELSFLDAFGGFLVDEELGAILDDQRLSTKYPQQIFDLLQKLKTTFSSFTRLAMKYHEPYRKAIEHRTLVSRRDPERESLAVQNTTGLSERLLQDPDFSDALLSEDSLDAILQKCKRSTQGLKQSLSFATLCSLRFGTKEELEIFRARHEIRATDLARIVQRQYLVQRESMRKPEPLQGRLANLETRNYSPDVQLMQYYRQGEEGTETVIVEYRRYEAEPHQGPGRTLQPGETDYINYLRKVRSKMRNLAGLLHDLSLEEDEDAEEEQLSSRLNYFQCLGFLEESERFRFAFLFRIPSELSFESATKLSSLSSYIDNFKKSHAPSRRSPQLEERFSLAYNICQAVLNLHSYGWVHKSIRSPNIILVPRHPDKIESASPAKHQKFVPYLKGFEFSRPDQDYSSRSTVSDPVINLYRHPARQDDPTEGFNKEHDLYAVGVVLLEIGMWKTVPIMFKSQVEEAKEGKAHEIRAQMMIVAERLLPSEMGTRYAKAVQTCIGGFGIIEDSKDQSNLCLAFRQQVLDFLEAGLKL